MLTALSALINESRYPFTRYVHQQELQRARCKSLPGVAMRKSILLMRAPCAQTFTSFGSDYEPKNTPRLIASSNEQVNHHGQHGNVSINVHQSCIRTLMQGTSERSLLPIRPANSPSAGNAGSPETTSIESGFATARRRCSPPVVFSDCPTHDASPATRPPPAGASREFPCKVPRT